MKLRRQLTRSVPASREGLSAFATARWGSQATRPRAPTPDPTPPTALFGPAHF